MRITAALAPLALAATIAAPAQPASAVVGCGGPWTISATCTFTAIVAPMQILLEGTAFTTSPSLGKTTVTVAVYPLGSSTPLHSCTGGGLATAQCSATIVLPRAGVYTCRVGGISAGTYACTTSAP